MKITNVVQEGMAAIKVEYDVYARISGSKLSKLNITVCEKSKIDLSIPVEIKDNLDKLNSSSDYFNNICYQATSDSGTDISLKDRKKEFVDGNNTVCQEDCDFSEYNKTSKKAKCSCKVKESSSSFMDMTINKTKLLENFGDIKSFLNINLLTCYENIFKIGGIVHNIGFYLVIFIIIFHIISFFIFIFKKISKIRKIINHIIFGIKNRKLVQTYRKDKENEIIIENNNIDDENNKKLKSNKKRKRDKQGKKGRKRKKGANMDLIDSKLIKSININNNKNEIINSNDLINSNRNQFLTQVKRTRRNMNSKKKKKIIEKVKKIMKYIDSEINFLSYKLALFYDKRTFFKFYISLLKTKHNLIFSFFYNNDYNSKIVKIDLFLISFAIYYIVNALFFDDNTMHKIYEDKGKFDIEYQLPKIIYSSLISMALNAPLKYLALSNDVIIRFKQDTTEESVDKKGKELKRKLKIRFILYYLISFLFLVLFWYYISIFGAVYKNTQLHLLKDTLISFGLSLLYPFGIYLFPGMFRIPALSNPKKNRECIYNFSKVLQIF